MNDLAQQAHVQHKPDEPNGVGGGPVPNGGSMSRSTSDGLAPSIRNRHKSNYSDDLDNAMRRGVSKGTLDHYHTMNTPQVFRQRTGSKCDEGSPSDLDNLLAVADTQSQGPAVIDAPNSSRVSSYDSAMLHRLAIGESPDSVSPHPTYLPKRESSGSFGQHHLGLMLEDDSPSSSSSQGFPLRSRSHDHTNVSGGVLTHPQMSAYSHEDMLGAPYPSHSPPAYIPSFADGRYPGRPDTRPWGPPSLYANDTIPMKVGHLEAALQQVTIEGNNPSYQREQNQAFDSVDSDMKRAFTNFHNQARFARDSTSPFLGGSSGDFTASAIPQYEPYFRYNMAITGTRATMPAQACSERDLRVMANNASVAPPLDTVDENTISIEKGKRMLKPVNGTETWESGRRYLIAPAVLSACPLQIVNSRLRGGPVQTAQEAINATSPEVFGSVDLGECLITYIGEQQHLSLGKWSECRLVLRQNYLLEYDTGSSTSAMPRGYVHLQYAKASPHVVFQDALELDFYASPCARADRRLLMIRVKNRADRGTWISCLNQAANLSIDDLWDYNSQKELARGRYAAVFPARRKSEAYYKAKEAGTLATPATPVPNEKATLEHYDCALKIIDKSQFWRRVVKGRERADTLVREASVQATLTGKFPKCPTFLRLRSVFETSDNFVLELELLEGTDLFQYVSSHGRLKEKEAASILRDILNCLDTMNRGGVAHRDIKPANVLISDKRKDGAFVKVGDFGMSTFVGVDGLLRGRCGTPGYVAPEVLTAGSGSGYSNKVDLFSTGVTLYVMLCGYEPFYGENEQELIETNKRGEIDFNEKDWKNISPEARDLVLKLTAVNPGHRISAKEALQHPWITRQGENLENQEALKAADVHIHRDSSSDRTEDGACTIS